MTAEEKGQHEFARNIGESAYEQGFDNGQKTKDNQWRERLKAVINAFSSQKVTMESKRIAAEKEAKERTAIMTKGSSLAFGECISYLEQLLNCTQPEQPNNWPTVNDMDEDVKASFQNHNTAWDEHLVNAEQPKRSITELTEEEKNVIKFTMGFHAQDNIKIILKDGVFYVKDEIDPNPANCRVPHPIADWLRSINVELPE